MTHTDKLTPANGDICVGDKIVFSEPVFSGYYKSAKFVGDRGIIAIVEKESYGDSKGQHTFRLSVCFSDGVQPLKEGDSILRKGRVIHRSVCYRYLWTDETARKAILEEKHQRGDKVRAAKAFAREMEVGA